MSEAVSGRNDAIPFTLCRVSKKEELFAADTARLLGDEQGMSVVAKQTGSQFARALNYHWPYDLEPTYVTYVLPASFCVKGDENNSICSIRSVYIS